MWWIVILNVSTVTCIVYFIFVVLVLYCEVMYFSNITAQLHN